MSLWRCEPCKIRYAPEPFCPLCGAPGTWLTALPRAGDPETAKKTWDTLDRSQNRLID